MARFSHFEVGLSKNGRRVPLIGECSFLGKNLSGRYKVFIRPVPGQARIHPFVVPIFGKLTPLPNSSGGLSASIYEHDVVIPRKGPFSFPSNTLRVLEILYGGDITVWELALVKQGESYFFTAQKNYEASCYEGIIAGDVFCPFFEGWPAMMSFLQGLLQNETHFLKPFSEYVAQYEPVKVSGYKSLAPGEGKVKWYNYAQGMGCIKVHEPRSGNMVEARVRWSHIKSTDQFKRLEPERRVTCGEVRRVHYPRSTFYWEVFDVSP